MNYHLNWGPFLIKAFYIVLKRLHSLGFGKIFPVQFKPLKPVSISHLEAPAHVCLPSPAKRGWWPGSVPPCVRKTPRLVYFLGTPLQCPVCPCGFVWGGWGGLHPAWGGGRGMHVRAHVCACVHACARARVCSLGWGDRSPFFLGWKGFSCSWGWGASLPPGVWICLPSKHWVPPPLSLLDLVLLSPWPRFPEI